MAHFAYLREQLRDIFDTYTPKFISSDYNILLKYHQTSNKILVSIRLSNVLDSRFRMKSVVSIKHETDLDFLLKTLDGLVHQFTQQPNYDSE